MKPIQIEPSILVNRPDAYIDATLVSMVGLDGEHRTPWAPQISVEDLLELLED